jgi:AraC-like DNA-binding protein
MHAQPAHGWTVDELARKAGLSRSALAQRFTQLLGQPPMQYLARWRLQIAAQALRDGAQPLTAIAERVGYESEAAFNRAFKREFGLPPASWRRSHSTTDGHDSLSDTADARFLSGERSADVGGKAGVSGISPL